jgi:hypothetical protein
MTPIWLVVALAALPFAVLLAVSWQSFALPPKLRVPPLVSGITALVAIVALAFAVALFSSRPPHTDEWAQWDGNFQRAFKDCVDAKADNCLAKAFNANALPEEISADGGVVGVLYRDLRAASTMLGIPEARDLLWKNFGIDNTTFVGTGYSVPMSGAAASSYEDARQREYFLPNFCADVIDQKVCPSERQDVWTWRLSTEEAKAWADRPVRDLLTEIAPLDHAAEFAAEVAKLEAPSGLRPLPRAFVRVGKFNPKYYAGTIGRPAAHRVFAADLEQVWLSNLTDEMAATGAATLTDPTKPDEAVFLWVYLPAAEPEAEVASWRSVFEILGTATKGSKTAAAAN